MLLLVLYIVLATISVVAHGLELHMLRATDTQPYGLANKKMRTVKWHTSCCWFSAGLTASILQSHKEKQQLVTVHDQNYFDFVQRACSIVAFEIVTSRLEIKSTTTSSQLMYSKWLWRIEGDRTTVRQSICSQLQLNGFQLATACKSQSQTCWCLYAHKFTYNRILHEVLSIRIHPKLHIFETNFSTNSDAVAARRQFNSKKTPALTSLGEPT